MDLTKREFAGRRRISAPTRPRVRMRSWASRKLSAGRTRRGNACAGAMVYVISFLVKYDDCHCVWGHSWNPFLAIRVPPSA
jgi:hypothetical protein